MQFQFIILTAVFGYLRSFLKKEQKSDHWQWLMLGGLILSLVLLFFETTSPAIRPFTNWIPPLAFIALIWLVFKNPDFKGIRSRVYIVLPYLLVKIVQNIFQAVAKDFYREHSSYFQTASLFAFIWLLVMLIISNKQKKALEVEKEKAAQRERELQLSEKLKAQLEMQVSERTSELLQQKLSLEQAILDLKATQNQLIQAEKMASLGELTAGIAHEIQNPLNFVNNFSELNKELISEMKEEINKGNYAEVQLIAGDIEANEVKISQHGKRADAIVKGMLQHSRTSSGQKESTDINALCDEYLRLAFHGLRAKDKSFNAKFETDFDPTIPPINIVPQDIGRVLLNLFNNAFYAASLPRNHPDHKPTVWVSTRRNGNQLHMNVKDNGPGIPDAIVDKIFQPFFTTKPTGQGTGLGLSLSYDIVKAHNGDLQVDTVKDQYTMFTVVLPL